LSTRFRSGSLAKKRRRFSANRFTSRSWRWGLQPAVCAVMTTFGQSKMG